MAKRPIKKRKQRKVVKKKPILAKKPKVLNPKFKLTIGGDDHDRFFVHPETVPDGIALQWVGIDSSTKPSQKEAIESGWKLVKECEPIHGLVLVWAPQAIADAQRDENIRRAQQQMPAQRAVLQMDEIHWNNPKYFISVVSEPYQTIPSDTPPVDYEVTVKFRLSSRYQDAAACMKLDPAVYAYRRLALYLRGELGGILLPVDGALELFENGNFNIQARNN